MRSNLIEAVKFCFTSKHISQISLAIDESAEGVERALERAIPLVVESLLTRAERPDGPETLLTMAREAHAADLLSQLSALPATAWYARGAHLTQDLAGEGYGGLVTRLASGASIRPSAAQALLRIAAAAVLSVLGKYAAENELSADQLVGWLQTQKTEIMTGLFPALNGRSGGEAGAYNGPMPGAISPRPAPPAGVGLGAHHPGAWAPAGGGATFTPQLDTTFSPPAEPRTGAPLRWQWGLLLLLAVSLGYFFGHERFSAVPAATALASTARPAAPIQAANAYTPAAAPVAAAPSPATPEPDGAAGRYDKQKDAYIYDTGQPIILKLADGTRQKVGANSTESQLYSFLATEAVQVDTVNRTKGWINFDRVYFEAGKATLTPESAQQLRNIAGILKLFPGAVVKLGGYTDSTGDPRKNFLISEERAKTAMLALAGMGIPADHLQARGYGAKYFVADNATPEGRALNRRISVRVVKK